MMLVLDSTQNANIDLRKAGTEITEANNKGGR
jgi:hypothetical protein